MCTSPALGLQPCDTTRGFLNGFWGLNSSRKLSREVLIQWSHVLGLGAFYLYFLGLHFGPENHVSHFNRSPEAAVTGRLESGCQSWP